MRLVTFVTGSEPRLGALRTSNGQERVIDLHNAESRLPTDMIELLRAGPAALALARETVAAVPASAGVPLSSVALRAPILHPSKMICIGANYREHAAESSMDVPTIPIVFAKYPNCLIGAGENIVLPRITNQIDYEGELAVVIGRRGREIAEADALDYVAGYSVFNDVSAREFQNRVSQWTVGKSFDTFAPMGPALVTADEVPDPQNLDLRVTIGDEVLQSSNTTHMIFSIAYLIEYLSAVMTLEPGDIIATGTPSGVGGARKPPRWLLAGEVVRVEVQTIGMLENPIVAQS